MVLKTALEDQFARPLRDCSHTNMGKGKKKVKKPKAAAVPALDPAEDVPAQSSQPPAVWRAGQDPLEVSSAAGISVPFHLCMGWSLGLVRSVHAR